MRSSLLTILLVAVAACDTSTIASPKRGVVGGTPLREEEPIASDPSLEPVIVTYSVSSALAYPQYPVITSDASVTGTVQVQGTAARIRFSPAITLRGQSLSVPQTWGQPVFGTGGTINSSQTWSQAVAGPCEVHLEGAVRFVANVRTSSTTEKSEQLDEPIPVKTNRACISPVANIVTSGGGYVGDQMAFDGSSSEPCHNATCGIASYAWKVNGTSAGGGNPLTWTFLSGGQHAIELTVTNTDGRPNTRNITMLVYDTTSTCALDPAQRTRGRTTARVTKSQGGVALSQYEQCDGEQAPSPPTGGRGEDGTIDCYAVYLEEWTLTQWGWQLTNEWYLGTICYQWGNMT
jgi:hypothetical protein